MIRLFALGATHLADDERGPLEPVLSQPKRLALLTYLLVARPGPFHRRDTVCGVLWGDRDQRRARAALSQSLYVLRKSLRLPRAILSRGSEEIAVDPELVSCDVAAFRAALDRGERGEALRLYRGDLLPGFYLPDAPAWESWLERERARLRRGAAEATWQEAVARSEDADVNGGLRLFRSAMRLGYLEEGATRIQMRALAERGESAAAIRLYESLCAVMREELELAPSPRSAALAIEIRGRHDAASAPAPPRERDASDQDPEQRVEPAPANLGVRGTTPPPRPRRSWRPAAVPASLFLLAVALGALIVGRPDLPREAEAPRPIVLSDFETHRSDSSLALAVTEAVRGQLSRSAVVSPLDRAMIAGTLRRMDVDPATPLRPELAREVAAREGVPAVVEGSVDQVGGAFVLSARIVATADGDEMVSALESAEDSTELMPAIARLGASLRAALGETLRSIEESPPLARVTTPSLPALKKYAVAVRIREREPARARSLLEEAVGLDPGFAMAYRWLATTGQPEAIERAYALADRLTEPERYLIHATYHQWNSQPAEAIVAYRNLLDIDPRNAVALWNLGLMLLERGDYRAGAEVFERYRVFHPDAGGSHLGLAYARAAAGDTAGAREVLAGIPDDVAWIRERGLSELEWVTGNYRATEDRLRPAAERWPDARWPPRIRVGLASTRGRLADAGAMLEARLVSRPAGEPLRGHDARLLTTQALVLAYVAEDRKAALRFLRAQLARRPLGEPSFTEPPRLHLAQAFAAAGAPERARGLLREFVAATTSPAQEKATSVDRHQVLGHIALAEGRPRAAIGHFRRAAYGPCRSCSEAMIGRAFDAAGQPDSARMAYLRYVHSFALGRTFTDPYSLGPALERLGDIHAERGQSGAAAQFYRQYIDLMRAADPVLQPRVDRVQGKLRQLARRWYS